VLVKCGATNKLNERQVLFVGSVVEGASRAEAARRPGFPEKYADRIGAQLMCVNQIARRQEPQRK
jgi:phage terminase small subunit